MYIYMCVYIYIYIYIYIYLFIYMSALSKSTRARPATRLLPVEVRCYISRCRCLARNARCNTTSHLTADAVFSCISRAKHLM